MVENLVVAFEWNKDDVEEVEVEKDGSLLRG